MQVIDEKETSVETSLAGSSVLIIPGWNGSGAGHWQTLWEQKYPRFRRVEQHNWTRPSRGDWMAQMASDIERAPSPVFLVAHSLGCVALAHWAATAGKKPNAWKVHSWRRPLG
jgi:predicted alpha/beta hydrolase family esterase